MRRDEQRSSGDGGLGGDDVSEEASEARHSVGGPYRDPRDALVELRRRLGDEHAQAQRVAARAERIARQLTVLDDQLRTASAPWTGAVARETRCRSRWEDMPGSDAVRRCGRCERDVHDLAHMTRDELATLFARADETPGVRLSRRPDGRVVMAECPPERRAGAPTRAAGWAAGTILAVGVGSFLAASAPLLGGAREHDAGRLERRILEVESRLASAEAREAATATEPVPASTSTSASTTAPPVPSAAAIDGELDPARHVRWIAPQAWEIDRVLIDHALVSSSATHHGGRRVIPHHRDGRVIGVRLYGVRRADLLGWLGIQNGDTILDINGHELSAPDHALEAYTRLRTADALFVRLERRGEERVHVYRIVGPGSDR